LICLLICLWLHNNNSNKEIIMHWYQHEHEHEHEHQHEHNSIISYHTIPYNTINGNIAYVPDIGFGDENFWTSCC